MRANDNVKKIFDLPKDVEKLPPIKFKDIFTKLEKYMNENDLWKDKLDIKEFKNYFAKEYNVDDIRNLGVNIVNLTPLARALKNVKRLHKECVLETEANFKKELMEKFDNHRQWLTQKVDEKLQYLCSMSVKNDFEETSGLCTRSMYVNLRPFEAIEILLKEFGDSIDRRYSIKINQFLNSIKNDEYLKKLFHLGMCFSKFSIKECLKNLKLQSGMISFEESSSFYIFLRDFFKAFILKSLKTEDIQNILNRIFYESKQQIRIETIGQDKAATIKSQSNENIQSNGKLTFFLQNRPTKHETFCQVKDILNKNISNQTPILTLTLLAKIEEKLISNYSCQEFTNLGYGSFLQFLSRNEDLLEELGSYISTNKKSAKYMSNQKKHFVNHLMQLCRNYDPKKDKNRKLVEKLLLDYYSVSNINDLGYGSFSYVVDNAEKSEVNIIENIIYEDSVLDESFSKISDSSFDQEYDKIIQLINDCPLLQNIVDFTKWNYQHTNKFGDIKDVIASLKDEVYVLQVAPNVLLKLDSKASIEALKESIKIGDSHVAAGQLVSLVSIKYGSLKNTPIKLLQSDIETSFVEYAASSQNFKTKSTTNSYSYFFSFIVDFLTNLPLKFATNCIDIFFIETLAKLEGSAVNVKEKIYQQCFLYEDQTKLKFLNNLSVLCNIDEWSVKKQNKNFELDKRNTQKVFIKLIEEEKQNVEIKNEEIIENEKEEVKIVSEIDTSESKNLVRPTPSSEKVKLTENEENNIESCKLHIEKIRRETFGADLESNNESKLVIDKLKGVIGRSLERLSKDLYNEDIHFVLELIQNADDNQYQPQGYLDPTLVFLIESDRIVLLNNENGFLSENIEAICNVGGSTKKKREQGYIGRKGIGFKSVFTITDSPQIHSNGYHIKFDISNGDSIGYILPVMCREDEITESLNIKRILNEKMQLEEKFGKMNTSICLPLKTTTEEQHELLISSFTDIKHSLLLFLNRLRNLVIVKKIVKANGKPDLIHCVYHRRDINENIIEIHAGFEVSTWLLTRLRFKVPEKIKPNDSIESTEVSLAFPVRNSNDEDNDDSMAPMEKYETYAYLPLKNFGFSFIIQADFDVPANRSDIKHDNGWNQLLIEKIPELFVNSLTIFKSYKSFKDDFCAIKSFIRFIPLEEEIYYIFKNTVKQIYTALRDVEFLPVIYNKRIEYKKPTECIVIKDPAIREILTPEMVFEYLGRFYMHDSLCNDDLNTKILFNLGVRNVTTKDILHALKQALDTNREKFLDSSYTAKWLVALKRCLDNSSIDDEEYFFTQLRIFKFIPLISGDIVSLDECSVFFPETIKMKKTVSKTSKLSSPAFKSIIEDLNIININSLTCLDEKWNAQILSLLSDLGIKYIEEQQMLELHILKTLKNKELVAKKSKKTLVSYVMCMFDYWRKNEDSFELGTFNEIIPILTNNGFKSTHEEQICFTKSYGNEFDVVNDFPGFNWCLISNTYLDECKKLENTNLIKSMYKFFRIIGVVDFHLTEKKKIILTADEIENSQFKLYREVLVKLKTDEVYVFEDHVSPVFDYYLNEIEKENIEINKLYTIFEMLYKIIENNWKVKKNLKEILRTSSFVSVAINKKNMVDQINKPFNTELCESEFYKKLRNEKWIIGQMYEKNEGINLYKPSELFVENDDIKAFYGVKVPYLAIKSNLLINVLSITAKFDLNLFLEKFKLWCDESDQLGEYNLCSCAKFIKF